MCGESDVGRAFTSQALGRMFGVDSDGVTGQAESPNTAGWPLAVFIFPSCSCSRRLPALLDSRGVVVACHVRVT